MADNTDTKKDVVESQLREHIEEVQKQCDGVIQKEKEIIKQKSDLEGTLDSLRAALEFHLSKRRGEANLSRVRNLSESKEQINQHSRPSPISLERPEEDKYHYMSIPAATVEFFLEHDNEKSTTPEIYGYLTAKGSMIGGKSPMANLTAVLHGDDRFESVKRGVYRLKPEVFQKLKASGHLLEWLLVEAKK